LKPVSLRWLRTLQRQLETTNNLPQQLDIADYLVTDRQQAQVLAGRMALASDEQLLLSQSGNELHISLYIEEATLQRLQLRHPGQSLNRRYLGDFCTVLEGLSHLLYCAFNAARDRPFSALELELQAEVDKYTMVVIHASRQCGASRFDHWHQQLFGKVHYLDSAKSCLGQRYRTANRLAARYCKSLAHRFLAAGDFPRWLNEIRGFYRLTQSQKMRRIATLNPY